MRRLEATMPNLQKKETSTPDEGRWGQVHILGFILMLSPLNSNLQNNVQCQNKLLFLINE